MVEGHKVSEDMDHLPKGDKVKKVWDTVAGWVKDYEAIEAKAEPAAQRRERALEDAFEDRAVSYTHLTLPTKRTKRRMRSSGQIS